VGGAWFVIATMHGRVMPRLTATATHA